MATEGIVLVDAPDKNEFGVREGQRTYKVTTDDGKVVTVRVRRDPEAAYQYVVENLVGGKWHRLLTGDTVDLTVPFDAAAARAKAVL